MRAANSLLINNMISMQIQIRILLLLNYLVIKNRFVKIQALNAFQRLLLEMITSSLRLLNF